MSERIPQAVAKRVVLKAYSATDHLTAATGKTIAVVISKNGGALANPAAGATTATEISAGWYYVDLSATDTGTMGPLVVRGTAAGIDDVEVVYEVASAHHGGFDGVPDVAAGAAGGLSAELSELQAAAVVAQGATQAGSTSTTIKLAAAESSVNDLYAGQLVLCQRQVRTIVAYNGTSKLATVSRGWDSTPDIGVAYCILPARGYLDLTQGVSLANTPHTLGDCLNGARAQAFGKWVVDADADTLTLYASDGTTALHVFDLTPNAGRPLARTPQ